MLRLKNWFIAGSLILAIGFANSCKKPDAPATNNNNNNNNNNNTTNNPGGPTIHLDQNPDNSKGPFTEQSIILFTVASKASAGTYIKSVVRNDGTKDTLLTSLNTNATIDTTYDLITIPKNVTAGTIKIKFTVTDSSTTDGKLYSNSIEVTLTTIGKPKQFKVWNVYMGDQTYQQAFVNTGGIPGDNNPQIFTTGQMSNITLRNTVDMVCGNLSNHSGVFLAAPAYSDLDNIPEFHMNTWTLAQRNKTMFKKIPTANYDVTTFKSGADVKTKWDANTDVADISVKSLFSPSDSYLFKTADGRYGAFTVTDKQTTTIKFQMAVESR